ncbi:MAG: hypothetical protein VXY23_09325 [Pseudomonadota bacterium]|nr:hypothetical protein [Pseudomonadota bacterium]HCB39835.1 hypothetical protein [Gammaproteobacteria bacterium]
MKSRHMITNTILIALALAAGTPAWAKVNIFNTGLDGACLYMKENKIKIDYQDRMVNDLLDIAKKAWNVFKKDKTPLCEINSPAGLLLASADYIDRATLNAAQGIDSIEKALGMKQTLSKIILELEKALEGENPAAQIDADVIKATEMIGSRAKEIEAELEKRKDKYLGSDEFRQHVVESQISLNAANYYQAQSALGVTTFRKYWMDADKQQRLDLVSANSAVGITSEFAENLPERATGMVENITSAIQLAMDINKSLDKSALKKQKNMIKKAQHAESKKAVEVARAIDQRTTSTFSLAKQEDNTKQTVLADKSDCEPKKNMLTGLIGTVTEKVTGQEQSADCP